MKKKYIVIIGILMLATLGFVLVGCESSADTSGEGDQQETAYEADQEETDQESEGSDGQKGSILATVDAESINLRDIYGGGSNYLFTYNGKDYTAIYYYDNWCIYDSYEITNGRDMKVICQALIDEHPVHGSDYESYRTAKDMVYEWKQHNIAHEILPEGNAWKQTSGNVDFDPEDQGKSLKELYEDRTGQEFKLSDHKDDIKEYVKNML